MTGARDPVFVTATARARPGSADALKALARGLVDQNRAEPGCLYYALHASDDDPDILLMYEVFASGRAFSEHMCSAHVHDFLTASAALTIEPLAVRAWRSLGPLPPQFKTALPAEITATPALLGRRKSITCSGFPVGLATVDARPSHWLRSCTSDTVSLPERPV